MDRIGEVNEGNSLILKFQQNAIADGYSIQATGVWDSDTENLAKRAIVQYGTRGNLAKFVQTLLINNGYTLPLYGADGIVGSETMSKIKSYQSNNGLTVDGIVGLNTWKKLLSV